MKMLAVAMPWLLVAIAAIIYSFVVPIEAVDSLWDKIKHYLIPMLIAGVLMRLGVGISDGIEEGLKQRQQPSRPEDGR